MSGVVAMAGMADMSGVVDMAGVAGMSDVVVMSGVAVVVDAVGVTGVAGITGGATLVLSNAAMMIELSEIPSSETFSVSSRIFPFKRSFCL